MAFIPGSRPPNRPYTRPGFRRVVEEPYRVNERITAARVRVVGENVKVDVYPIHVAIKLAQEQGLDLVEISPNADPPVCKVIDYSKFKYEQKKKQKEIKREHLNYHRISILINHISNVQLKSSLKRFQCIS